MPKEFYTEKDIEDLFKRGIRSLQVTENVVLTELAYEKAKRLDFQLISDRADNPPAAPVRPYLSEWTTRIFQSRRLVPVAPAVASSASAGPPPGGEGERHRKADPFCGDRPAWESGGRETAG